ncbi:cell division ATP-binding protein FtsE [Neobacillus niacini]|uniref:cell division ATP-binding protein FtsE n=1 Tax=Neobacillus niacini TaxID=86668 RepID=UPI00285AB876|nr:cell division ATP-binding protein FtsE [Neobacillus niacini]MDR7002099.1 cell division transport system ATP-binding protein [Neobacillus niacini]
MIQFQEVTKVYPNGVHALKKINLQISTGEFILIIGESGAGKSTLNKLITREEKLTGGELVVNGINVSTIKDKKIPQLRRSIGMVFQDFRLLSKMTVYENVAFAQETIGVPINLIRDNVYHSLKMVGLESKANDFPKELAGGEQQRVAIARAIVNHPKMIIADEPTGNLDSKNAWEIMKVFESINKLGTTVIMTTHNKEFIEHSNKRVILIGNGSILHDHQRKVRTS